MLFLSPCLCEGNFGGVQLSGRIARDRLSQQDQEFRCVTFGNAPGIIHNRDCAASQPGAAWKALALRAAPGDVVFWHVGLLKLLPAAGSRGRRVYLFLHGIECWRTLDRVTQHLLGRVDCFLVNSSFTWKRFIENNPRWANSSHRVVSLGLGVPEPAAPAPPTALAAVILGRMQRGEGYKGHEELIRAWPRVRRSLPAAELWIAGGGSLEMELKQVAAQVGESSHVRFFGVISEEQKQRLITEARCVAMPSTGEGFGLVYLEAMRLGRPCLSSTVDAGREVVNPPESGLAADPDDLGAISDAIVRLLTPGGEWDHWSACAAARYGSKFTAAHFGDRLLQALRDCDAGPDPRASPGPGR